MSGDDMRMFLLLCFAMGCRDNKVSTDSANWWEEGENGTLSEEDKSDAESSEEDKPDVDKEDFGELEDCPEDFDPQASCEGSWETTICMYDGLIWWCENGVWLSEEDK